jgi:hypothetical protein
MPFVGMVVSGLVGILFLADLAAGFPFQRVSMLKCNSIHIVSISFAIKASRQIV